MRETSTISRQRRERAAVEHGAQVDVDGLAHRDESVRMSELRAREVFEYLIKKGVQNRMHFKGYGSSRPVAGNDTEAGRAQNRRVEFEIIRK